VADLLGKNNRDLLRHINWPQWMECTISLQDIVNILTAHPGGIFSPFYDEPSKFLKEAIYGCTDPWALSSSSKHALIMLIMVHNLRAYVIKASFTSANQNSRCFGFFDRVLKLKCRNGSNINDYDRTLLGHLPQPDHRKDNNKVEKV